MLISSSSRFVLVYTEEKETKLRVEQRNILYPPSRKSPTFHARVTSTRNRCRGSLLGRRPVPDGVLHHIGKLFGSSTTASYCPVTWYQWSLSILYSIRWQPTTSCTTQSLPAQGLVSYTNQVDRVFMIAHPVASWWTGDSHFQCNQYGA